MRPINHCAALVHNLPTSILVRPSVGLLTIPDVNHFDAILFYEFRVLQIPETCHFHTVLSCKLV